MNLSIKNILKSRPFQWLILISTIITILTIFITNGDEIEFNSANETGNINNQKGDKNIVVNTVEAGANITIADKISNFYPDTKNPKYLNERDIFTSKLFGKELIEAFFELGNFGKYREACSLFKQSKCNSSIGSNVSGFSNYWNKLDGGYKILDIYLSDKVSSNGEKVYCVRYEYKLKQDMSYDKIQELFQFRVREREDELEEITSRVCEEKMKGGRVLKCEIQTTNFYCK